MWRQITVTWSGRSNDLQSKNIFRFRLISRSVWTASQIQEVYETSISKIYGLSAFNQEAASLGCQRTVAINTRKQSDCHRTTSYITCIIHYVCFVYPKILDLFSFCLDQLLFSCSQVTLLCSSRSRGRKGHRPLWDKISLFSCSFRENWSSRRLAPP